jgi:hypothetical protein
VHEYILKNYGNEFERRIGKEQGSRGEWSFGKGK